MQRHSLSSTGLMTTVSTFSGLSCLPRPYVQSSTRSSLLWTMFLQGIEHPPEDYRPMIDCRSRSAFLISCWLLFEICSPSAALSASSAELISNFRMSQGLGRVTLDPALNRIAQEQATAMAARLDPLIKRFGEAVVSICDIFGNVSGAQRSHPRAE